MRKKLREDKDVVLQALNQNWRVLRFAEKHYEDKEV
jgi:hypothetical protein